ncbi:MAG: FAD-binding oxidoreductase, partial [Candidatus Obscuribacterales bacterium]|nr:FAD-binding oxidoreductase [Steroidobacteraceae bacterium]
MGHEVADVCIIGGGIAGCSAALELAERGYRVVLLEAEHIGWGASGRSGGQIIPGYACEQTTMDGLVGQADAKRLWDTSIEAIQLLRERIDRHEIDCDWRTGHLQVGIKDRHRSALHRWHETLRAKYDYRSTRVLDRSELGSLVATDRYCAGLHDNAAGHLHPLKYTLGLARAAANAGAHLYEHSAATDIQRGPTVRVRTAEGCVSAQYVVLCGNAYLKNLVPQLSARIMPIGTYIIATEPLGEARARQLIADDSAVTDTNFILDYFRRSADHRLLFGGRVSYSGHDVFDTAHATAKRMLRVFPQLTSAKVEYAWAGNLDITMNRAPDFGRVEPNIYY